MRTCAHRDIAWKLAWLVCLMLSFWRVSVTSFFRDCHLLAGFNVSGKLLQTEFLNRLSRP